MSEHNEWLEMPRTKELKGDIQELMDVFNGKLVTYTLEGDTTSATACAGQLTMLSEILESWFIKEEENE